MIVLEEFSKETAENGRMMGKSKDRCLPRIHRAELWHRLQFVARESSHDAGYLSTMDLLSMDDFLTISF